MTAKSARVGRCARPTGTGERSHVESCRVTWIFSLWAQNSVPMTWANTLHGGNLRTSRGVRGASLSSFCGRNCHQYREASGAMVRASSVY